MLNIHYCPQAQQKNKQSLELSKFLHYYTKFKKHEVTRTMEELFVEIVKNWRVALSDALNIPEGIGIHKLCIAYFIK